MSAPQQIVRLVLVDPQAATRLALPQGTIIEAYLSPTSAQVEGDRWIVSCPDTVSGSWVTHEDVEVCLPNFEGRNVLQILHLHRVTFADLVRLPVQVASRAIQRLDDAAEAGLVSAVHTGAFRSKAG